jgi:hypothetical protein
VGSQCESRNHKVRYTWAGVNDMQALFRKVMWGVKQSRDAFDP